MLHISELSVRTAKPQIDDLVMAFGDLLPALDLSCQIGELLPESEILFIGALGKMEMELVPREGYEIRGVPVSNLSRSLSVEGIRHNIKFVSDLIKSGPACRKIIEGLHLA